MSQKLEGDGVLQRDLSAKQASLFHFSPNGEAVPSCGYSAAPLLVLFKLQQVIYSSEPQWASTVDTVSKTLKSDSGGLNSESDFG